MQPKWRNVCSFILQHTDDFHFLSTAFSSLYWEIIRNWHFIFTYFLTTFTHCQQYLIGFLYDQTHNSLLQFFINLRIFHLVLNDSLGLFRKSVIYLSFSKYDTFAWLRTKARWHPCAYYLWLQLFMIMFHTNASFAWCQIFGKAIPNWIQEAIRWIRWSQSKMEKYYEFFFVDEKYPRHNNDGLIDLLDG